MHQLHKALLPLLGDAAARGLPKLLVEPSAGGGSLASKVQDLGPYLAAAEQHPWLGVCFDTCHETIGKGKIGTAEFAELMTHPAAAGIPVIVETPASSTRATRKTSPSSNRCD